MNGEEPDPPTDAPPELRSMLPVLVVVYALMIGLGWLWLHLRDRGHVVPVLAVGGMGPVWAAGAGLASGVVLHGMGRLLVRYVRAVAELEARLAALVGPLTENQVLVVVLASAIGEEFFFRCAMQDALGLWITAGVYALAHLGGGPALRIWMLLAGGFGLAMGLLVDAGLGLLAAAIAHALFNYFALRRLGR